MLMYKKLKVSQGALLLTSRDKVTQQIACRTLRKEDSRVRVQFKPVSFCREIMIKDPGARCRTLAMRAKNAIGFDEAVKRREAAEALPVQGQMLRESTSNADFFGPQQSTGWGLRL